MRKVKVTILCSIFLIASINVTRAEEIYPSGTLLEGDTTHEIPYYILDSGIKGDTALIVGGMHGLEIAGWKAAEEDVAFIPLKGKIIVIPRINKYTVDNEKRCLPEDDQYFVSSPLSVDPSRSDNQGGNLDRYFPELGQTSDSQYAHSELGKAIWDFVKQQNVKWLLNGHETSDYYLISNSMKTIGQVILSYDNYENAKILIDRLNDDLVSIDCLDREAEPYSYKKFSTLKGADDGCLNSAISYVWGKEGSEKRNSFILETASHSKKFGDPDLDERIKYHKRAAKHMLEEAGIIKEYPVAILYTKPTRFEGNITVSWGAKGALAPFDYLVQYKQGESGEWKNLYEGKDQGYLLQDGVLDEVYYFRVKARSADIKTFGSQYGDYMEWGSVSSTYPLLSSILILLILLVLFIFIFFAYAKNKVRAKKNV